MAALLAKLATMVPRDDLTDALGEAERLRQRLQGCVSKDELAFAKREADGLAAELARLQELLAGMVPRDQLDALRRALERAQAECEALRSEVAGGGSRLKVLALNPFGPQP